MPLNIDNRSVYDKDKIKEEYFLPSTIETIDTALTDFVDGLNIFCETNEGSRKVPIIWTSAERSFQIKNDKDLRDSSGVLIKPVITIERTNINKNLARKGALYAALPEVNDAKGGVLVIARRIKQDKTQNFQNARSKRLYNQNTMRDGTADKTVYETITIPLPIYIEVSYGITLHAEYQQQINQLISPFITRPGGINLVKIKKEGHAYEAFIQEAFGANNNLANLSSDERKYETRIEIKVLGYIIGDDKNEEQPKIVRRENAVEVKIPRERVIMGDINDFLEDGLYRE
tara:strand:+ start:304 stop:1167 length:864 start_codon:yes stop_codon:yes gene_type:complete